MHIYKTTAENGTASYEIQKSRFIAYTSHVETEAEARDFVAAIKKKHFDARHNCSAWVLGADSSQQNPTMMVSREALPAILFWRPSSSMASPMW